MNKQSKPIVQTDIFFKPGPQAGNVGDQLINREAISLISGYGNVTIDDSGIPDWYADMITGTNAQRLSRVSSRSFGSTLLLRIISSRFRGERKRFFLVFNPGHSSHAGLLVGIRRILRLPFFLLVRTLGCEIVRMGFSLSSLDNWTAISESLSSRLHTHYLLRDSMSLAFAKERHFRNTGLFPDFSLNHVPRTERTEGAYVVVSLRSGIFGNKNDREYFGMIKKSLRSALESPTLRKAKIILAYQVSYDEECTRELAEFLREHFDVELKEKVLSLDECEKLYAGALCVISNRLHVLLLSLLLLVPAFPLIDKRRNSKITGMWKDAFIEETILDLADPQERYKAIIEGALADRTALEKAYSHAIERNRIVMKSVMERVFVR